MDRWHIGEPADWGDGIADPINWGHGNSDDNDTQTEETNPQYLERDRYSKKA